MIVKHVSLVNKPLELGFLDSLKESMTLIPVWLLIGYIILFIAMIFATVLAYKKYKVSESQSLKKRFKEFLTLLGIVATITVGLVFYSAYNYHIQVKPMNVTEASSFEVVKNRNLYALNDDDKALEKMSKSSDIIYMDQNGNILNKFPDKVSDKEKNKAELNGDKIKSVTLYGSSADKLVKRFVKSKEKSINSIKILSVEEKDHEVTIQYVLKR